MSKKLKNDVKPDVFDVACSNMLFIIFFDKNKSMRLK